MNVRTLNVALKDRSYPVHIGAGILDSAASRVPLDLTGRKIFILADRNVETHAARLEKSLGGSAAVFTIEGGEKTKSFGALQTVLNWLLENRVDRRSVLFVVGGGVLGDLGGFAAAVVLRGIPFVQVPTTLLAQVDSSVGGKTGINTAHGKNLVGAFYQPVAVLCDTDTLAALPGRELKSGYAEIVKYGLLGNAEFYEWLEKHGKDVLSLSPEHLAEAIYRSCAAKADIVSGDEFEREGGLRALLNLGHTFAHALEAAAGYDGRLLHGEAVSIGMVLAFRLSARMGLCTGQDAMRMEKHLSALGLKTEISHISPALTQDAATLCELMYQDKKTSGGAIGFILSRGIGTAFQSKDVSMADVADIINISCQAK